MGRIGIYGGTFNPPHRGHMQAARQAVELLNLDKLLLIRTMLRLTKPCRRGRLRHRSVWSWCV